MTVGESALFTLPPDLGFGGIGTRTVPPNSIVKFEVELVSWITVVDICKDGGIVKKILKKGDPNARPDMPSGLNQLTTGSSAPQNDGLGPVPSRFTGRASPEACLTSLLILELAVSDITGVLCISSKFFKYSNITLTSPDAFGETGRDTCNDFAAIPPNSALGIDMELESFKPVIDVCGDLKVIKKILKEGVGTVTANEGTAVQNGTVSEKKGFDGDGLLEFITDEASSFCGASNSWVGQSSSYNEEGSRDLDLALDPPSSTVIYVVEMVDFTKEKAPWELSSKEKIEAAGKRKEEGNLLFESAKYLRAGKKYDKAADYVSEDGSFGDDDQKLAKALRISCWLNGAACSLKLNNYGEAISLCSKVLDVEFCNVKALYRRVQAYMETTDLDLAELDIKRALEADPQNR
ncbi:hypothetical protein RJ641_032066 [Dillenia turbinata]|uniref:peptidylprolyl isomerase n=1 Tax=Dillenia turbinata TaxID=194707 RepID=A0AAN8VP34_9MAGN